MAYLFFRRACCLVILGCSLGCTTFHGQEARSSKSQSQVAKYELTRTQFIDFQGTRYAFRTFGVNSEFPLVLFQHFRGSMDNWDPALLNALAGERTVIVFDNKGVSSSSGKTPDSFRVMADDAAEFIQALGYKSVDILGFSIGGAVAQELLLNHPDLVHRAILAGTAPQGGEGLNKRNPEIIALATKPVPELNDFLTLFFTPSEQSQTLGKAFLERRGTRGIDPEPLSSAQTMAAQNKARKDWGATPDPDYARLWKIKHPVLVANGSNDIMMPTVNSFILFKNLPNAQLILYPDSGHGFLFQYPELFAEHVSLFLRSEGSKND
jgi:pimeloyl-ACP methyl ester carboxylesterase